MLIVYGVPGSPGASTTAIHVAANWASSGREVLLLEADPAGGSMSRNLGIQFTPGAASFVASGSPIRKGDLVDHSQDILFTNLHVMPCPSSTREIIESFAERAEELRDVSENDMAVVVDAGRVGSGPFTEKWLASAAGVAVVVRGDSGSSMSNLENLASAFANSGGSVGPANGCVVTIGKPLWSPADFPQKCGLELCGTIENSPETAVDLSVFLDKTKRKTKKWRSSLNAVADQLWPLAAPDPSVRPRPLPAPLPAAAAPAPPVMPAPQPEAPAAYPEAPAAYQTPEPQPEPPAAYQTPEPQPEPPAAYQTPEPQPEAPAPQPEAPAAYQTPEPQPEAPATYQTPEPQPEPAAAYPAPEPQPEPPAAYPAPAPQPYQTPPAPQPAPPAAYQTPAPQSEPAAAYPAPEPQPQPYQTPPAPQPEAPAAYPAPPAAYPPGAQPQPYQTPAPQPEASPHQTPTAPPAPAGPGYPPAPYPAQAAAPPVQPPPIPEPAPEPPDIPPSGSFRDLAARMHSQTGGHKKATERRGISS